MGECIKKRQCDWWFCREKKICLLWHYEQPKAYREHFADFIPIRKRKARASKLFKKNKTTIIKLIGSNPFTEKDIDELRLLTNHQLKIFKKTNGLCWLCGEPIKYKDFSRDHVLPKSKGGKGDISNLMPAHKRCNAIRSNDTTIRGKDDFIKKIKDCYKFID